MKEGDGRSGRFQPHLYSPTAYSQKGSTAVQLSSCGAAGGEEANRFSLKFIEDYRYCLGTLITIRKSRVRLVQVK